MHLARDGFRTYATMGNIQKAEKINEIVKTEDLPLSAIQLDVTDNDSIDKAIDTVLTESGRIDVCVLDSLRTCPVKITCCCQAY